MADPLVTVVTPTYNRAHLLPETIESVIGQDYANLEYIVLDDGSTDSTCDILRRYEGRLCWETHPNMGEARTVNKGWRLARGEYVVTVNSDDPVLPGLLREGVRFMEANPDVLVGYPDFLVIDERSRPVERVCNGEYDYLKMLRCHHCLPGPGTFIRRRAFQLAGMRDPGFRYVGDFEYWIRLGLHGPFARIPQELATWRTHVDATTLSAKRTELAREHIRVTDSFFRRKGLPAAVGAVEREAKSAAYYVAGELCFAGAFRQARSYYRLSAAHGLFWNGIRPGGQTVSRLHLLGVLTMPSAIVGFLSGLRSRVKRYRRCASCS